MPMIQDPNSTDTELFIREAVKAEGLTYHAWCKKYGIISPAKERQIRRHEVPLDD